jgi:hypothetical protein
MTTCGEISCLLTFGWGVVQTTGVTGYVNTVFCWSKSIPFSVGQSPAV